MLKDRVALISGAATGIGEAVARLFASQGAHTFILDRDLAACRTVADSIVSAGGAATAFGGDVRRRQDVAAWVETAISAFGRIDVLVNNAGICHPEVERDRGNVDHLAWHAAWDEMQSASGFPLASNLAGRRTSTMGARFIAIRQPLAAQRAPPRGSDRSPDGVPSGPGRVA